MLFSVNLHHKHVKTRVLTDLVTHIPQRADFGRDELN